MFYPCSLNKNVETCLSNNFSCHLGSNIKLSRFSEANVAYVARFV